MPVDSDRDYVLGTHDEEIARLGVQHAVWRPRVLDAWRRAGISRDQRVLDFGSGPGYASLDLADIVGPGGRIIAVDRSARFLQHLQRTAAARGLGQIEAHERDLDQDKPPAERVDATWCRWVLSFLSAPRRAVARLVDCVRPGGAVVIHEYLDCATWQISPRVASFDAFVAAVMASWRAEGGEPNIGVDVIAWLQEEGCAIEQVQPLGDIVGPDNFVWHWPAGFFESNLERLVTLGRVAPDRADVMRADFAAALNRPGIRMVTPLVLEIIARKRG